jgi:DeoR family transcriptional regulator, aga operon transcriptional repressor
MLNEERRRAIVDIVNKEGRVLVKDLADRFETSHVTIRGDLESLHSQGLIHRTHGGALPLQMGALLDPSLHEKEKLHRAEKQRMAEAAVSLVHEGESVVLDSGTTVTAVARALRKFRQLTVITNAVNIAAELAGTSIEVLLTGGILRERSFSLVGPMAEESLRRLSADILFLGVDGFDVRFGLTTPNLLEANVNRTMMQIARRTVVICDSSKFGRRGLSLIAPVTEVQQVITDNRLAKSDLRALKEAGIEVIVA